MAALLPSSCCCWRGLPPPTPSQQCLPADSASRHSQARPRRLTILAVRTSPEFGHNSALSAPVLAPLAACLFFTTCAAPAAAGFLSGAPGLESIEFPPLPGQEFFKDIQEENKKKYEGYDAKLKSSPLVQELLKRSKENAEKHKQEIQDKYCRRGADWGVGDCSLSAMSEEQREAFLEAFKEKEAPQ